MRHDALGIARRLAARLRSAALCAALATAALPASPALAQSYYLSPDVATNVGGTFYRPWQIVRNDAGAYGLELSLPSNAAIDALHRTNGGPWLFSLESRAELNGTPFDPRDIIRYDGFAYVLYLDGVAAGIPNGSNVDAVYLDGGDDGDLILSFDVPTTIGFTTFRPADLVRYNGLSFSMFFQGTATVPAIPFTTNVTGADNRGALTILTFDVATTLGATTYSPGELVAWDGTAFSSYFFDPAWPVSSRADAVAFLADPGRTLLGLEVLKSGFTPGDLRLIWPASCAAGAEDYGIYEGSLGSWTSHTALDCFDDGANRVEEITPGPGNRYYLVVPHNPNDEGSYGLDGGGGERPAGVTTCMPAQHLGACP